MNCDNPYPHVHQNYGDPAGDNSDLPDDKVRVAVYTYGAYNILFGRYGFTMTFPNLTAAGAWANSCQVQDEVSILHYRSRQKFSDPVRVIYGPR